MRVVSLKQVVEYQLCCGCGLCAYLYPEDIEMVDVPCFGRRPRFINAGELARNESALSMCPGAGLSRTAHMLQRQGVIEKLLKDWGPIMGVWEGYAADPEIRFKGSSGGALTAISLYCLECEQMYGVLHTTSDNERPYLNKTVLSKSRHSLLAASGSRYSPASPCEGLHEIESAPRPCVFIGKPCDASAVQNSRKCRPALYAKVGVTMACFCAGTPSTNGTLAMLKEMGVDSPDNLVTLRYRGHGWPGKTLAVMKTDEGIKSRELSYQRAWGDILQRSRQWRCYICPDHTGEFADIAVGDPWYREIKKDEDGRSLILVRTEKGKEVVEGAISNGYLVAEKTDPSVLPASQPNLIKSRALLSGRLLALKLSFAPCPSYIGFCLATSWLKDLDGKEKAKSILSTMKRIYKKKLRVRQQIP